MSGPLLQSARFRSFREGAGWVDRAFSAPRESLAAMTQPGVIPLLERAEQAARQNQWAVLAVTYEAAPAFDAVLPIHPKCDRSRPLAWLAIFDQPTPARDWSAAERSGCVSPPECLEWRAAFSPDEFERALRAIHAAIACGETYQANLTFPLLANLSQADYSALASSFESFGHAQQAPYAAELRFAADGDEIETVLSLSPELFFHRVPGPLDSAVVTLRPMKGTAPRGLWLQADRQHAATLAASVKERAENLMIVDLLRSDIGRLARPGSVRVQRLFEVERYPTLWQMTSTITAAVNTAGTSGTEPASLPHLFQALFPCGSVTGAPKVATMRLLNQLEAQPRGLYCGAIGFVAPGGEACFNVAIRTLHLRQRLATYSVGSGITWDSTAPSEYNECLLKARVLRPAPAFAPCFCLLETLRLERGGHMQTLPGQTAITSDSKGWFLLPQHLERVRSSAEFFGIPFDLTAWEAALEQVEQKCASGAWRVRLLLDRRGAFRAEVYPLETSTAQPLPVAWASAPVDSSDVLLYHKTNQRAVYDSRVAAGDSETIYFNQQDEVTEARYANLVLIENGVAFTPPRESGLLAGTLRDYLLASGALQERVIRREQLQAAKRLYLLNSVRGVRPAALIDQCANLGARHA